MEEWFALKSTVKDPEPPDHSVGAELPFYLGSEGERRGKAEGQDGDVVFPAEGLCGVRDGFCGLRDDGGSAFEAEELSGCTAGFNDSVGEESSAARRAAVKARFRGRWIRR